MAEKNMKPIRFQSGGWRCQLERRTEMQVPVIVFKADGYRSRVQGCTPIRLLDLPCRLSVSGSITVSDSKSNDYWEYRVGKLSTGRWTMRRRKHCIHVELSLPLATPARHPSSASAPHIEAALMVDGDRLSVPYGR